LYLFYQNAFILVRWSAWL